MESMVFFLKRILGEKLFLKKIILKKDGTEFWEKYSISQRKDSIF
ncbi:MAG: hypothetical protein CM15mP44_3130 [Candidatus Neomarinimicrobiota bacterium]|nr:MAG: hypothetical protein CM15mP44_3130 [Candidatus Neomarinimicrobiota bacterium]